MNGFVKHSLLLFLALRIGDVVNLAAGMWFVPKYVSPEEIGAVLPLTSFATLLSLPVFAFAMTVMKESAWLAAKGERGYFRSVAAESERNPFPRGRIDEDNLAYAISRDKRIAGKPERNRDRHGIPAVWSRPRKARPCVSAVFFGKTPETAVERCK